MRAGCDHTSGVGVCVCVWGESPVCLFFFNIPGLIYLIFSLKQKKSTARKVKVQMER